VCAYVDDIAANELISESENSVSINYSFADRKTYAKPLYSSFFTV